jgi:hypothetical protein
MVVHWGAPGAGTTIAGFALSPIAAAGVPEITTAITPAVVIVSPSRASDS